MESPLRKFSQPQVTQKSFKDKQIQRMINAVPRGDEDNIYIPVNKDTCKFGVKGVNYCNDKFLSFIPKEEFDDILLKAEYVLSDCWNSKKIKMNVKIPKINVFLSFSAVFTAVVFFTTFYYSSYYEDDSLLFVSATFVALSMLMVLYVSLSTFFQAPKRLRLLGDVMKQKLEEYFSQVSISRNNLFSVEFHPEESYIHLQLNNY